MSSPRSPYAGYPVRIEHGAGHQGGTGVGEVDALSAPRRLGTGRFDIEHSYSPATSMPSEAAPPGPAKTASPAAAEPAAPTESPKDDFHNDPLVKEVLEMFEGELKT